MNSALAKERFHAGQRPAAPIHIHRRRRHRRERRALGPDGRNPRRRRPSSPAYLAGNGDRADLSVRQGAGRQLAGMPARRPQGSHRAISHPQAEPGLLDGFRAQRHRGGRDRRLRRGRALHRHPSREHGRRHRHAGRSCRPRARRRRVALQPRGILDRAALLRHDRTPQGDRVPRRAAVRACARLQRVAGARPRGPGSSRGCRSITTWATSPVSSCRCCSASTS